MPPCLMIYRGHVFMAFFQGMEWDSLLLFSGVARDPLDLLGQKEYISSDVTVR